VRQDAPRMQEQTFAQLNDSCCALLLHSPLCLICTPLLLHPTGSTAKSCCCIRWRIHRPRELGRLRGARLIRKHSVCRGLYARWRRNVRDSCDSNCRSHCSDSTYCWKIIPALQLRQGLFRTSALSYPPPSKISSILAFGSATSIISLRTKQSRV
jgi:hypothetical protein